MNKSSFYISVLIAVLLWGCGGGGKNSPAPPADYSPVNPLPLKDSLHCKAASILPTIDGVIETKEWSDAQAYVASMPWLDSSMQPTGNSTQVFIYVKNNVTDLYLAFQYHDPIWDADVDVNKNPVLIDLFTIAFDEDQSGVLEMGEDRKVTAPIWAGGYFDKFGPGGDDTDYQYNGFGRMLHHDQEDQFHVEFSIPLSPGDGDDADLSLSNTIGFYAGFLDAFDLINPLNTRGQAELFHGLPNAIGILKLAQVAGTGPPLPPPFSGKLALISRRDFFKGDIFVQDFATGLTRITNGNTFPAHDFYKDCVSLSYDRQWIVFHGAPTVEDYGNYELYKIKTDGTQLTKLTDLPGVLVGHPAFSPDGSEIVFARQVPSGGVDIFVMDANTGVVTRRLTDTGYENNDPDWSLDGKKIVFKSRRWTGKEQVAIMDADGDATIWLEGKNVLQLTNNNQSDHDGVYAADGKKIIFERYVGPGDWTDPMNFKWGPKHPNWRLTVWEMWDVSLDGLTSQKIITPLKGIQAEWLPVSERSPENGYAFIRNWGLEYSEVFRVHPMGGFAHRVVPKLTFVTFFDWK